MRIIKILLIFFFINIFFVKISTSKEKLPLNDEQKS